MIEFTDEQRGAIERRDGDLLLDAGAGSGKTSVLVERFVRAVLDDGVDVSSILTITFTDKAAGELRDRIRSRLRELGAPHAARATEGAFISTIHGFCARVLRANALIAGIDPRFVVLDGPDAERLADGAFDEALEDLAANVSGGVELIAAYGRGPLRGAILAVHAELRSGGMLFPRLPQLAPPPPLQDARLTFVAAAERVMAELGATPNPAARVERALERVSQCGQVLKVSEPWPAELDRLALPGGNGAALSTPACVEYGEALGRLRRLCEHHRAQRAHLLLDHLLAGFGERYAACKRESCGLDFEDLELETRSLLERETEVRDRYRTRFAHVMVDELQDTNQVQLELIEAVSSGNLFTVGDAQQAIYGFRHADVALFERRGERLAQAGRRARLKTNFRSRPEILEGVNAAFDRFGFTPLIPSREAAPGGGPLVELLVADKGADWQSEGLAAPWRVGEARALARRVGELIAAGGAPRDVVVLTRATTDIRIYERALEDVEIPTYVIGGRGYWSHPQVVDLVAYLRALANPRDEEALYTVLASPLVGASLDALVVLGAAARRLERDPWWVLEEPEGTLDGLAERDNARLKAFADWFTNERVFAARGGVEELIDRVLEQTRYDLVMLSMPGGQRRLANVRKLMRLGREAQAAGAHGLRSFLEVVRARQRGWSSASREGEAAVEGEALDAVRLMTIHRAKGLEFDTVCVADLGRGPVRFAPLMRLGRDGRFGVRLSEPGTGKAVPALDYEALGEERQQFEEQEQRRLFYVAMTRARERLILSGAAKLDGWPEGNGGAPIGWIGPAFVDAGVPVTFIGATQLPMEAEARLGGVSAPVAGGPTAGAGAPEAPFTPPRLSYSAIGEYRRCGYRFYVERVLRLPLLPPEAEPGGGPAPSLSATDRGILAHALLEKLDFRRPVVPPIVGVSGDDADELTALIAGFARSELNERLARIRDVRREERFAFVLPTAVLVTGAFDVLAREPGDRVLVVDYKSDRLDESSPEELVESAYGTQRLLYAVAALKLGAALVDVVHVFLERPDEPIAASFERGQLPQLVEELSGLASGILDRDFRVTEEPHRRVCAGCPAEGGLCSWPLEMTRRERPDRPPEPLRLFD